MKWASHMAKDMLASGHNQVDWLLAWAQLAQERLVVLQLASFYLSTSHHPSKAIAIE